MTGTSSPTDTGLFDRTDAGFFPTTGGLGTTTLSASCDAARFSELGIAASMVGVGFSIFAGALLLALVDTGASVVSSMSALALRPLPTGGFASLDRDRAAAVDAVLDAVAFGVVVFGTRMVLAGVSGTSIATGTGAGANDLGTETAYGYTVSRVLGAGPYPDDAAAGGLGGGGLYSLGRFGFASVWFRICITGGCTAC